MISKKNLSIIFENDDLVAVNKPAGLLTIPDREQSERSLKDILQEKYGSAASLVGDLSADRHDQTAANVLLTGDQAAAIKIYTVHRLDKDTSGLIIFAKNEASHKYLSNLFQERKVEKYYLGVVHGSPLNPTGTIDAPISEHPQQKGVMTIHRDGKPSLTTYEVIEANKYYSLVSFQLHTGRTHQIRVHAKHIGHPLVCDPLYGDGQPLFVSSFKKKYKLSKHEEVERPLINRLALHSYKLKFEDMHGNPMELIAEMPKEFSALVQQLKKNG